METIEKIHDFTKKFRQPGAFPYLDEYIKWQQKLRKAIEKNGPLPKRPNLMPLSINLDLTTVCNYACDHCIDMEILNSKIKHEYKNLVCSLEVLIAYGLRSVILIGGGESTLHPKFRDIVIFLKENGIQIGIVTNGSRNEIIYDVVDHLTKGDWVRFSLDSGNTETFLKMHKPKKQISLEEICSWTPKFRIKNPNVSVGFSFIITWGNAKNSNGTDIIVNIEEIIQATEFAKKYNFNYISFKPFLTRYPDGEEVMDANVIAGFEKTIAHIHELVNQAKKLETDDFKVVESTNLKLLISKEWEKFTHQPNTCHMQAMRLVLTPLGLYNCPSHRGISKALIADKNAYCNKENAEITQKSIVEFLNKFDAKKECKHVTCLFNGANWWLENIINENKTIEPGEEMNDYYF